MTHPADRTAEADRQRGTRPDRRGTVLGTGWSAAGLVGLIALGLPRTVLADLGIVLPESSWVYYLLALTPFAVWLVLAVGRRTATPVRDYLVAGALYGLSLVIVHELFWNVGTSLGHTLPPSVLEPAGGYASPLRELIPHGYAFGIAMLIGLGVGLVVALVAALSALVRRAARR
ncbi:MAG TPA: hypothetical protein VK020_03445 [Microlunatus sp.]|nr:hypothetical protein [Microlunatus sp.]